MPNLKDTVSAIAAEMRARSDRGAVAHYIPELARVDAKHFGIAVVAADGTIATGGDSDMPFSIQSVSKVFTLTLALGRYGDRLWRRVGREPSGSPFNSIVQLEREQGIPRNPFINAALANYKKSFGVFDNPVELTLGVYFHQCSIAMSCKQLAMAGRYLAQSGCHPKTGLQVIQPERARRINAVMLTCGHYDGSGEFAYRVGLPGKSGVGGGILAIAPGKASIAVWSPGLDAAGNSHLGRVALEALSKRMNWSIFGA